MANVRIGRSDCERYVPNVQLDKGPLGSCAAASPGVPGDPEG